MSRRFCQQLIVFIAVLSACACSKQPESSASKQASATPPPQVPSTQTIASNIYFESGGCESKAMHLTFSIPDVDRLDPSYTGPVAGIEFVELARNGNAGYRSVVRSGNRLELDVYADGAGTKDNIPSVGERCVNAAASSVGYNIVGHYR